VSTTSWDTGTKEIQPSQNLAEIREVTEDYWDAWTVMLCYLQIFWDG